ncbi:MAG: glycosyltransferase family 4 protein [Kiritimatiellae bacterium]|nr:glycosyltransferase family 4 protein [Kiritimatiellia bacterium]MDW8458054.1 glycosyltransferase family 4 protein [Verrucomicrobiota bacterium]
MKVLLLAPQPFYEERGTPIAVKWVAETLAAEGHEVDLVTFPFGRDVSVPGVRIFRARRPRGVQRVPIGFSVAKLRCDAGLFQLAGRLVRETRYDVVHACEESIFFARRLASRIGARVVYDMDSSMADQLIEKWGWLRLVAPILYAFERYAIRSADLVLPVCRALADKVERHAPGKPCVLLHDMAMDFPPVPPETEPLRERLGIRGTLALYVGNLEHYQGVDLLLEGFAAASDPDLRLVIIGGREQDVANYRARADSLGLAGRAFLLGPRPLERLMYYLQQADILVSPRLRGVNTPMKIYSYLAAGRAIVATRIESHTQVLDDSVARLVDPEPTALADALTELARDPAARQRLGAAAATRASERHSREAYRKALRESYSLLARGG